MSTGRSIHAVPSITTSRREGIEDKPRRRRFPLSTPFGVARSVKPDPHHVVRGLSPLLPGNEGQTAMATAIDGISDQPDANSRLNPLARVTGGGGLWLRSLDDCRLRFSRCGLDDCRLFRTLGPSRRVLKHYRRPRQLALNIAFTATIIIDRRLPTTVVVIRLVVVELGRFAP